MESPYIEYEWQIKRLKNENQKLKERLVLLGHLVFEARDLANEVIKYYPGCCKSTYELAEEFLKNS